MLLSMRRRWTLLFRSSIQSIEYYINQNDSILKTSIGVLIILKIYKLILTWIFDYEIYKPFLERNRDM